MQPLSMKKMKGLAVVILVMLVVVVVGDGVDAQSLYACWGGCYNECFFGNAIDESQKLACDYSCLNTCIPSTAADYGHYCHLGCSLKRCIPFKNDGAKLEECFGWCTDLCSGSLVAP